MLRLLLNGEGFSVFIEFHHAVLSGISYIVSEDRGALLILRAVVNAAQHAGKALSVKNIVSQYQSHRIRADKIRTDNESVRQASGLLLHRVLEFHSQLASVLKKIAEYRKIPWSGYDQHLTDPRKHQCR